MDPILILTGIGVIVAIGAWLWPRSDGKTPTTKQRIGDVGSGQVYQAGRDVIVNQAPAVTQPEPIKPSSPPPIQPTADISIEELSQLLLKANAFRQKDIVRHYEGKTFRIRGRIEDIIGTRQPMVKVMVEMHSKVYIFFRGLDSNHFDYIRDDGWFLDCIAPLDADSGPFSLAFGTPEWYDVKPHGLPR